MSYMTLEFLQCDIKKTRDIKTTWM